MSDLRPAAFALLLACAATPPAAPPDGADTWPAFRGPGGLGVAAHANAPLAWNGKTGENVAWKVSVPKPGPSSPVVWKNLVFLTGSDEDSRELYCFDAGQKGKLLWKEEARLHSGELPQILDGTTWSTSTPATDGERVYAIFVTGEVLAVGFDGRKAWSRIVGPPQNAYGHASSLLVHGGKLLVQFDDKKGARLLALDARSGETVWERKREGKSSWTTPILTPAGEVVLVGDPMLSAFEASTGKPLWQLNWIGEATIEAAPSAAFADGVVFAATDHHAIVAVAAQKILWKYEENLTDVASPVASGKHVVMASSGGCVTCLDAKTGRKVWEKLFDESFHSSPVVVGDRVYVTDKTGVTFVLRLGDKYEELAKNEIGGRVVATPAFPEGRILIRTDKHLACIGTR